MRSLLPSDHQSWWTEQQGLARLQLPIRRAPILFGCYPNPRQLRVCQKVYHKSAISRDKESDSSTTDNPIGWNMGSTVLLSIVSFLNCSRMILASAIHHVIPCRCTDSHISKRSCDKQRTCRIALQAIPSDGRSFSSMNGLGCVNWVWRYSTESSVVTLQFDCSESSPEIHSIKALRL